MRDTTIQKDGWSHIVTLPGGNCYCYLSADRMQLRAVGDCDKAPGQVVCVWDDKANIWRLRNDPAATPFVRWKEGPPEKVRRPRPHRVVVWLRNGDYLVPELFVGGRSTGTCWQLVLKREEA